MSVEPSSKLRELFLTAVAIESPADREAYLLDACGSDLSLRRRNR